VKRNPKIMTFEMENLRGLGPGIDAARRAVLRSKISYSRLARQLGVAKNMVAMVLTGRRTSKRVLDGIIEICKHKERA